jgi:hypothetical protein
MHPPDQHQHPNSLTSIGVSAFEGCTGLTTITIPDSVISIGFYAFAECTGLTSVYFERNAPVTGEYLFDESPSVTVFYRPGASGWDATFAGRPTALWVPSLLLARDGPDLLIFFTGTLEAAEFAAGPYNPVADTTSPLRVPPSANPARFWRTNK